MASGVLFYAEKKILAISASGKAKEKTELVRKSQNESPRISMQEWNLCNPKKVGSKLERGEYACKRAAEAQRDLFRQRRSKEADGWLVFLSQTKNKSEQSSLCSDLGYVDKKDTLNANTEPDYSRIATKLIIS